MSEKSKASESQQVATGLLFLFFLSVLGLIVFVGVSHYRFTYQDAPDEFPQQSDQKLDLNEYFSDGLSGLFKYDTALAEVAAIKAISIDSFWGRTFVFEYLLNDGSKLIAIKPKSGDYEQLPKQFEIKRIKDDYFSVLIETDGAEYEKTPKDSTISDIYFMTRFAYDSIENKELVSKRWKAAQEKVKTKRLNYAKEQQEHIEFVQKQIDAAEKVRKQMLEQIEAAKSISAYNAISEADLEKIRSAEKAVISKNDAKHAVEEEQFPK